MGWQRVRHDLPIEHECTPLNQVDSNLQREILDHTFHCVLKLKTKLKHFMGKIRFVKLAGNIKLYYHGRQSFFSFKTVGEITEEKSDS